MPNGVTIQNNSSVQHFYTALDRNNGNNVVFADNVDPGNSSIPFSLAADFDGTGSTSVQPTGMVAQLFFSVVDGQVLPMN